MNAVDALDPSAWAPDAPPPQRSNRECWLRSWQGVLAWVILALSLLLTLAAWNGARRMVEQRIEENARAQLTDTRERLVRSMTAYEQVLDVAAAYVSVAGMIDPGAWEDFVGDLSLPQKYPGLDNLAVAMAVPGADKVAHENQQRARLAGDYAIRPRGNRPFHAPIVNAAPFESDQRRLIGLDLYSEPRRRAAMERARDSGETALSGRIALQRRDILSDSDTDGFLVIVPAYRTGEPRETPVQRRAALLGWVVAPLRIQSLLTTLTDGMERGSAVRILDLDLPPAGQMIFQSPAVSAAPLWQSAAPVAMADRRWQLQMAFPANPAGLGSSLPGVILSAGIVISLLLFAAIMTMVVARVRAMNAVLGANLQLRQSHERKQAELRRGLAQFEVLREASPFPMMHVTNQQIDWINDAALALLGYQRGELVDKSSRRLFSSDDAYRAYRGKVSAALAAAGTIALTQEIVARNGASLLCEGVVAAVDPNQPRQGVVVTFQEVGRLRETEIALYESERFCRLVFETAPFGLALARLDGSLAKVNPAYARILGVSVENALTRNYWEVTPVEYGEFEKLQLETMANPDHTVDFEKEVIHADGYLVPVRLHVRLIERRGEKMIWAVVEEITARIEAGDRIDELGAQVQAQQARLQETDREKMAFLDNMSHELKTPLNAIVGFSELLVEGIPQPLEPEQKLYAEQILTSARELLDLTNDVLAYSHADAGNLRRHVEAIDVAMFLARCVDAVKAAANARQIDLTLAVSPDCTVFMAQREHLRKIVDVLLAYTLSKVPGGGEIMVSASLVEGGAAPARPAMSAQSRRDRLPPGRWLELNISGEGARLDIDRIVHLFEPFAIAQAGGSRPENVSSLALALARRMVQVHDGMIDVTPTARQGSNFRVRLPWRTLPEGDNGITGAPASTG